MIIMGGSIGVGKTSYTRKLAKELGTKPFFEPVDDNPILDKYYEDPDKYGFSLQIYFLNKRFALIKEAYKENNNVLDRSLFEDALFTAINVENGTISQEEYSIYLDLVDNMLEELEGFPKKSPDLMIYLTGDFDHILSNIKKRGRVYEQPTEDNKLEEYYKQVYDKYNDWFDNYEHSAKLKIDTTGYDIHKEDDWQEVYAIIQEKLKEVGLVDEKGNTIKQSRLNKAEGNVRVTKTTTTVEEEY